jgi:hypothetical protein
MKKEITPSSSSKKILGLLLYFIAFLLGLVSYLLKTNLKANRNIGTEDNTTDGMFKELRKKNPSIFDPRPPKDR